MDSVIGTAIKLVGAYTVVPIARQMKYVFFYKSRVASMKDAIRKLENEKEIVDLEKDLAQRNLGVIDTGVYDWLEDVTNTQEEVSSLARYEEGKAKMNGCCMEEGVIVNPIARHKLGRRATKTKLAIETLCQKRPKPDHEMIPSVNNTTEEAIFRSSHWEVTMEKILLALKDDRTDVIGLCGMGGVGKSTMINEVVDEVQNQYMFDEVTKVIVGQNPEIVRMQEEIALAMGLNLESESPDIRADILRKRLLKTNRDHKKKSVLIILDDLWVKLDLQEVGIPLGGNDQVRIKLLLSARNESLLSNDMGVRNPIHLGVLSDRDELTMFLYCVGDVPEGFDTDKLTRIAKKCGGHPIVIKTIANVLKNKTLGEWEEILKPFDDIDVLEKLKVSYDYLPSRESKDLFLLCGIIRGPHIQVRDLLKYSFGLRLYNRKDSSTLVAAAAKLKKMLSDLEDASMLIKSDDSRCVCIHDQMRELAIKIIEEDRPEWAYDVITLSDNSRELLDVSKLKLLLSRCEGDAVELGDSFLKDMKELNVVEFTNLRIASPTTQFGHLRNLGMLCLHNCFLDDISLIGELKGLHILSFRGSDICKLPIQLRELIVLKMLDLSDCKKLTQIEPNVLGSLTMLEDLNMDNSFKDWAIEGISEAPPSNARLIELKNMSRLSNLRIHIPSTSMLPRDGQFFSSKLTVYQIMFGVARKIGGENAEDSDCYRELSYEYNKFSRVLMLTFDSPDTLWQEWVQTTLQTTEVLYLSGRFDGKCGSIGDMCNMGFDCLKHLRVRNCTSLRFIISLNDNSSTYLESLFLENLKNLEKLCEGGGMPRHEEEAVFSKLKIMNVHNCNKVTHLFDFYLLKSHISSQLEDIIITECAEIQCIVVDEGDNNYDVVRLFNLKKMEFRHLRRFSTFCSGPSSNVLFAGKKVAFPCLKFLVIDGVSELVDIWHPTDPPAELGNLQSLQVGSCEKLVRVINSNVLMSLQYHLESLIIYGCELMKEVFDVDDGIISSCTADHHLILFSRLRELRLQMMKGLQGVHNNKNLMMMTKKGGLSITIFPYIELLDVSKCPHLRYVLYGSLPTAGVGVFGKLKEMTISDCEEMEAIVVVMLMMVDHETVQQAGTLTNNNTSSNANMVLFRQLKRLWLRDIKSLKGIYITHNLRGTDNRVLMTFPNIESLDVSDCPGLRYVLSWSSLPYKVGGFVQLRKISIVDCDRMDAIVVSEAMDQETQSTAATC